MTAAATRSSLSGPQIWSLAILALAIALVSLSFPAAPRDMADDLPASIYDIAVKVVVVRSWCKICSVFSFANLSLMGYLKIPIFWVYLVRWPVVCKIFFCW